MFLFSQVAWLRVDTQTILTIQNHVITKNKRIGITYTEKKTWQLRIRDIRESDRGWYMCQINTDPMKSQMGYLDVVGSYMRRRYFTLVPLEIVFYFKLISIGHSIALDKNQQCASVN